jgi:hypothetical protein
MPPLPCAGLRPPSTSISQLDTLPCATSQPPILLIGRCTPFRVRLASIYGPQTCSLGASPDYVRMASLPPSVGSLAPTYISTNACCYDGTAPYALSLNPFKPGQRMTGKRESVAVRAPCRYFQTDRCACGEAVAS